MRVYLYILAGLTSALIGWSLGQFFITDVGLLARYEEIILFPCVAISLAVGMVLNEIFLSSPTRPKLNMRSMPVPVAIAAGLGLVSGLVAGSIVEILILLVQRFDIPSSFVRTIGWLCIGGSVGLAEGFTWRWRSIEAGNKQRFRQRFRTSIIAGIVASLIAALAFEALRKIIGPDMGGIDGLEDPLGLSILGILLGLAFSLTVSPSYMVALRAGAGFEYIDRETNPVIQASPVIKNSLRFLSLAESDQIEEGLSIQLPSDGKIKIGSAAEADIYIPEIAGYLAHIELRERESFLVAKEPGVEVNGSKVRINKSTALKHNHILTFKVNHTQQQNNGGQKNGKGLYRFVYYNRFLDPQA